MHMVTLSFDDGFLASNRKIAAMYEARGLSACFNVVAMFDRDGPPPDRWQTPGLQGDFDDWNELQARGHEIMPHGYRHVNKAKLPFDEAQRSIRQCLDVFADRLEGFDARQAVFNFPYNASTPELEAWLPSVVRAFRARGGGINPLPHAGQVKLTTTGFGPPNCEADLEGEIAELLSRPSGWLIYNTHGLDDEGWGPIGSDYLARLLDRLLAMPTVKVMPAGAALRLADAARVPVAERPGEAPPQTA